MSRRKVLCVFGTRPEAIKMAPVVHALRARPDWCDARVVVTGQHREQLDQMLAHFGLTPDHDLQLMQPRQTLPYIMTAALRGLSEIMSAELPDLVLVHGDTLTTFAAALAAFYAQVPVGHVEAGLRTYNKHSPWPEEMNRRCTDLMADICFAPTLTNADNLRQELVPEHTIFVTGQTVVDAALATRTQDYVFTEPALARLDFARQRVIYVTAHRRENWGEPMRRMFAAMRRVADDHPDVLLVYAVHLSPAVRDVAFPILSDHERIWLIDPLGYADNINLLARSYLMLSDSGGFQEEAPCFGVPLVLMRDTTERPEAMLAGTAVLAGTDTDSVYGHVHRLLTDASIYNRMSTAQNPFGDGQASARIADYLAYWFGFRAASPAAFA